jgi:hypothetical protein
MHHITVEWHSICATPVAPQPQAGMRSHAPLSDEPLMTVVRQYERSLPIHSMILQTPFEMRNTQAIKYRGTGIASPRD